MGRACGSREGVRSVGQRATGERAHGRGRGQPGLPIMADRFVSLDSSPLAPGRSAVRIRVREFGSGDALMFLHGGWGYAIYPFDGQIAKLERSYRVLVPDRTGYGQSGSIERQLPDFHDRAAAESLGVLDVLGVERAILWGHSDGAVIALRMALIAPRRVAAVVAEATHFFRSKPGSRAFFETMRDAPDSLGSRVAAVLEQEHGTRWRSLIKTNGAAWLQIADEARSPAADLYDGQLPQIRVPTLVVHGSKDPRTEPGELDALTSALGYAPHLELAVLEAAGHSPHSERDSADAVTKAAVGFLSNVTYGLDRANDAGR
jgi:3-oxoadipate enol-lactonase